MELENIVLNWLDDYKTRCGEGLEVLLWSAAGRPLVKNCVGSGGLSGGLCELGLDDFAWRTICGVGLEDHD